MRDNSDNGRALGWVRPLPQSQNQPNSGPSCDKQCDKDCTWATKSAASLAFTMSEQRIVQPLPPFFWLGQGAGNRGHTHAGDTPSPYSFLPTCHAVARVPTTIRMRESGHAHRWPTTCPKGCRGLKGFSLVDVTRARIRRL